MSKTLDDLWEPRAEISSLLEQHADPALKALGDRLGTLHVQRASREIDQPTFEARAHALMDELFDKKDSIPDGAYQLAMDDLALQFAQLRKGPA